MIRLAQGGNLYILRTSISQRRVLYWLYSYRDSFLKPCSGGTLDRRSHGHNSSRTDRIHTRPRKILCSYVSDVKTIHFRIVFRIVRAQRRNAAAGESSAGQRFRPCTHSKPDHTIRRNVGLSNNRLLSREINIRTYSGARCLGVLAKSRVTASTAT